MAKQPQITIIVLPHLSFQKIGIPKENIKSWAFSCEKNIIPAKIGCVIQKRNLQYLNSDNINDMDICLD